MIYIEHSPKLPKYTLHTNKCIDIYYLIEKGKKIS